MAAYQDGRFPGFGAAAIGWAASSDGGKSWKSGTVPRLTPVAGLPPVAGGPFEAATDPWLAFGPDGRAYVAALVRRPASAGATTAIVVSSTANLGKTWRGPVVVHESALFDDKESIAVDSVASSPFVGRVYVAWSIAGRAVIAYSTDQARSWSAPVDLGGDGFSIGVVLAIEPQGRVHALWRQSGGSVSGTVLRTTRSNDGGATWSAPQTVAEVRSAGVAGVRTGDGLPTIAFGAGRLHVAWQDGRFAADETVHLAYVRSTDGGTSWSVPKRVSGGTLAAANFLPALSTDGEGRVALLYLSLRHDPARRDLADLYARLSLDGGVRFGREQRLTSRSFDLRQAARSGSQAFLGDYFALAPSASTSGPGFTAVFVAPWLTSVVQPTVAQPDVLALPIYR